ncbi:hypothetical protein PVAND_015611 [Polypedilum vanderplanki]|uniref:Uncharacterized protein n=1 Tax=Polypedilum vanderplanki TaxID=319348 RepID=A0A9J6BD31_POLVA|nr:hypothetical protein PVAND_015611 [Polypedilum vanderplanki]
MNKLIFALFVTLSLHAVFSSSNLKEEIFYTSVEIVLHGNNYGSSSKIKCIVQQFRNMNLAEKYTNMDIITHSKEQFKQIKQYADEFNIYCTCIEFIESPIGLLIIAICVFTIALFLCCCLLKKYCQNF